MTFSKAASAASGRPICTIFCMPHWRIQGGGGGGGHAPFDCRVFKFTICF